MYDACFHELIFFPHFQNFGCDYCLKEAWVAYEGDSMVDLEYISTHPSHQRRASNLEKLLPKAFEQRLACDCPKLSEALNPIEKAYKLRNIAENVRLVCKVFSTQVSARTMQRNSCVCRLIYFSYLQQNITAFVAVHLLQGLNQGLKLKLIRGPHEAL